MIKTADLTPRQKKIAIAIAALIVLYVLFGFIGAPFIVRGILEKQVAEAIDRQVTVERVRVNPLTLSVTLRNLSVKEHGGAPFADFDEVYANLQTASLFKWALVLKTVQLTHPNIYLVRSGAAAFNFSDIGGGGKPDQEPAVESTDTKGLALAIYDARIANGTIALDDRVVGVNHRIEAFNLNISDFSSRPGDTDVYTLFDLAARVNGASVSLEGKSLPFDPSRKTHAEIDIEALDVPHYLPYVPLPDNLRVSSLTLETGTEIEFQLLDTGRPELVVAGILTILDARLVDGNGDPFVNHPELKLDILPSRVLSGELRLAELASSAPEVFIKRLSSGEIYLPFLAVQAHDAAREKAAEDTSGKFRPVLTIDRLHLEKGVVHFSDQANSEPFVATITDLSLGVDNFGYNSDRTAVVRLDLKTDADESLTFAATAKLDPVAVSGEIDVSDIEVSRYLPYYKDFFEFKSTTGELSFGSNFRFRQEDGAPIVSLAGIYLDVQALTVVDEDDDEPLISLEKLRVAETTAELASREATVGDVFLEGMQIVCRREKDGALNLAKAFVPTTEPPDADSQAAPNASPAQTAGSQEAATPEGVTPSAADSTATPFVVNLKQIKVADVAVEVEDRVPATPVKVRLDEISFNAADLSTAPDRKGEVNFSLRWEQGGQFQAGGSVTLDPLGLDLNLDLAKMDIRPFQPYVSEHAALIITNGLFSTRGRLRLSSENQAAPAVTYAGKAGLNRFASIDREKANDFLKWTTLELDDLEVGVNPTRLSIDQISLADFFARIIVDADGSVNLVSMFGDSGKADQGTDSSGGQPPKPAVTTANNDQPTPVSIARVILSGGDVDFSDRFIKPNFNAKFHDLGGRISGLESIAEKRADVLLEGMWANHAPVKITGEINPLIQDPFVDLNLNISDIELSPFSPYSGKYIGYILEKGKLTFNVAYLMEKRRLEGKNSIFIDQLTLGDSVDSPDAVSLPIKMAVALLKDRDGNIELDLPVSGSLDDPEFKVGKVVLTVLKNIIVKIVTSPFAVLGALAGGGEELSYLDFDAGISEIGPDNAGKIDKLTKILYERPGLKLDIQGTLAPEADSEALRAQLLENRLKAEKLQRMVAAGQSAVPIEEIVLQPEERQAILEAVFAAAALPAPVDASGNPVELTPEIMETLLRNQTAVTQDDLRKLANARAFAAKEYLLASGQMERERIFIVEPTAQKAEDVQEGAVAGRVIFSLK